MLFHFSNSDLPSVLSSYTRFARLVTFTKNLLVIWPTLQLSEHAQIYAHAILVIGYVIMVEGSLALSFNI